MAGRDVPHRAWALYSRVRYGPRRDVILRDGRRLVVQCSDFRAFRIAQLRGTQPEKIAVWKALAQLGPDLAIDVGANYGEFTAAVTGGGLPVIAVEASPMTVSCLRSTFSAVPQVTVVHGAAVDVARDVTLFVNERSSGSASLAAATPERERTRSGRAGRVAAIRVPGLRVDDLVKAHAPGARSLILKIDVEGFEMAVLQGALPLLETMAWWRAMIEFGVETIDGAGGDAAATWDALRRYRGVVISRVDGPLGVSVDDVRRRATELGQDAVLPNEAPFEADVVIGRGPVVVQQGVRSSTRS